MGFVLFATQQTSMAKNVTSSQVGLGWLGRHWEPCPRTIVTGVTASHILQHLPIGIARRTAKVLLRRAKFLSNSACQDPLQQAPIAGPQILEWLGTTPLALAHQLSCVNEVSVVVRPAGDTHREGKTKVPCPNQIIFCTSLKNTERLPTHYADCRRRRRHARVCVSFSYLPLPRTAAPLCSQFAQRGETEFGCSRQPYHCVATSLDDGLVATP
jgi:hypothetical protein